MTSLERGLLLSEDSYLEALEEHGDEFDVRMGAEAIFELLRTMDLAAEVNRLRSEINSSSSETKIKKFGKRLKLIESFLHPGNRPEWMVLTRSSSLV